MNTDTYDASSNDRFICAMVRISQLIDASHGGSEAVDLVGALSAEALGGFLTQREAVEQVVAVMRQELPLVYNVLIGEFYV